MTEQQRTDHSAPETPTSITHTTIAAYDAQRVTEMLRDCTPQQVLEQLEEGVFDERFTAAEKAELTELLQDWQYRALGLVTLRDALLVDRQRGERVYTLLCQALTVEQQCVSRPLASIINTDDTDDAPHEGTRLLSAQQARRALAPSSDDHLAALLTQAETNGLACAVWQGTTPRYPFPAKLETLLPPMPAPYTEPPPVFEQPVGWRRALAIALVFLGAAALGIPLLLGQHPVQPAGLPLGLFTLALLIGIRAGWPGYTGSFCIWLVPNQPEFHYGTTLPAFLHAFPLLLIGLLLLAFDSNVRAMWRWLMWRWMQRQSRK